MNTKALLTCAASLAVLLLGCGAEQVHARTELALSADSTEGNLDAPPTEQLTHGVEFKEGRGLTVPQLTRESLGLQIVDVEEGQATRRIKLALRVFDLGLAGEGGFALASASTTTNESAFLQPGTTVRIGWNGAEPLRGEVLRTDPASARVTGLAEVIVRVPAEETVKVGSFLDGYVNVTTLGGAVIIPKEALLKTAEGSFAYVVNGDSLFRTRIEVGGQEGEVVEVTDGLYAGDQVVLQPIMALWLAELQAIRGGKACADGH